MKRLIIAEKPSVARDIAAVLGAGMRKDGYIEGAQDIITWAVGHLVSLAMPEEYDIKYKKWDIETLPVIPNSFKLKVVEITRKQFSIIKNLMNRKDVKEVVCATDAGREGELIFRYIYKLSGSTKPIKRLWISSLTGESISKGFNNLKPGSQYINLYYSARCRAEADWLVGINATRAFTVKNSELFSIGRVQTPTLAILVNREKEIQNFKSKNYWEVKANFGDYTGTWIDEDKNTQIAALDKANSIKAKVINKTGIVTELKKEQKKEKAPLLYDLSSLQQDSNKLYGFSAQKTLDIAQKLYESKLITYPRTDSRYLPNDIDITAILKKLHGYKTYINNILNIGLSISKRIVNDEKITDHHAIIPTGVNKAVSENESKIYDLIVRRLVSVFMPDYVYENTELITDVECERFISKGKTVKVLGWKELDVSKEKEKPLPSLIKGQENTVTKAEVLSKKTQPPKRYTEGNLLRVMENVSRLIDDEKLKESIKDKGLGTAATRASIIERLIKVKYITKKGKALVPSQKGIVLIDNVSAEIKNPEITAIWEKKLKDIEVGVKKPDEFMKEISNYTKELVNQLKSIKNLNLSKNKNNNIGKCPVCGAAVTKNKKGYGCSAWKETGCKFFLGSIAGKKLSEKQVKDLLEKGITKEIKGFTSKKKTKFSAKLKIDDQKKVVFEFDN